MKVTRIEEADAYSAAGHFDVCALRLQGMAASNADFAWVGLSHFLPGGGCEMDASPLEKIYVVLEGAIEIQLADGSSHTLCKLDSCYIAANEARAIRNTTKLPASMLVVMPPLSGGAS